MPVVTTSVNRSGMDYMTSLEDLDNSIRHSVDIMIYDGELKGRPSKIIDLVSEDNKVIER